MLRGLPTLHPAARAGEARDQEDMTGREKENNAVRVAVVDQSALLREGIRRILDDHGDLVLTAEAGDPAFALDLARAGGIDVLLLETGGPKCDELDTTERLLGFQRGVKLLLFARDTNAPLHLRLLRLGAHGILLKSATPRELLKAIRTVHRGRPYVAAVLQRAIAAHYLEHGDGPAAARLTNREIQVLRLLAEGRTNREIAAGLHLSIKTVDSHRARLLRKLGLRNNSDLTRFAIREGLAKP
jgi:DNA-binding NarL/FixJ family response regulator